MAGGRWSIAGAAANAAARWPGSWTRSDFARPCCKAATRPFANRCASSSLRCRYAIDYIVVAGKTGSGKTRLLLALAEAGAQVLDLEGLARHRGSVLGGLPHEAQPSQKAFDTQLWHCLTTFDARRPVVVESESRKIGQLQVPTALLDRMRASGQVVMVTMPDAARVQLLVQEYGFFAQQPARFCAHLDTLADLRGRDTVAHWQALARDGRWAEVFADLMHRHYDPLYLKSMQRNYAGVANAQELPIRDGSAEAMREAAASLTARTQGSRAD